MNVKQLYEILGKYIEAGAGEWVVKSHKRDQFKTRKEYRNWLKSKLPLQSAHGFDVGEVIFAEVHDDVSDDVGKCAVLCPAFFIKDENKATYYLPSEEFVKGEKWNKDISFLGNKLELADKTSKGSKKRTKKSVKTTKGSKKK
jgi:hypothetical protein